MEELDCMHGDEDNLHKFPNSLELRIFSCSVQQCIGVSTSIHDCWILIFMTLYIMHMQHHSCIRDQSIIMPVGIEKPNFILHVVYQACY